MNLCSSNNRQSRASEFSSNGRWFTLSSGASGERAGVRGVSLYIKHYRLRGLHFTF
jgi:hypothetical protein